MTTDKGQFYLVTLSAARVKISSIQARLSSETPNTALKGKEMAIIDAVCLDTRQNC